MYGINGQLEKEVVTTKLKSTLLTPDILVIITKTDTKVLTATTFIAIMNAYALLI